MRKILAVTLLILLLPLQVFATVTNENSFNVYTGNGVTTVFPYSFKILASTDLTVSVNGVTKTITTDYTVSGVGASGGGNVTFVVAPATSSRVVLERDVAMTQTLDLIPQAAISADALERALDKLTMLAQQSNSGVRSPSGYGPLALPLPGASQCLAWNVSGTSLVYADCGPTTVSNNPVAILGTSLALPDKVSMPSLLWEAALGTSGAPVTLPGPILKISVTRDITTNPTSGCSNQIDNECGAALEVIALAKTTSKMMNTGFNVWAGGTRTATVLDGGSNDNIGIYSIGEIQAGSTEGSGTGIYAEGIRRVAGANLQALGIEIQVTNFTDTSCSDPGPGNGFSNCTGLAVLSKGNETGGVTGGVGVRVGGINTNQRFQTGFACQNSGAEAVCFDDVSTAVSSIRMRGTHTYGLNSSLGTFSGPAILLANNHRIGWGTGATPIQIFGDEATGVFVGAAPTGSQAPGPLSAAIIETNNATGKQAILGQVVNGTMTPPTTTVGADKVAVSGWTFRGTGGTTPIYGGNFGVRFTTGPYDVNGVEIDVQNEHSDLGALDFRGGRGLWINGSGTHNRGVAMSVTTVDSSRWWSGLVFGPNSLKNHSDGGHGIYFAGSQSNGQIVIQPSDNTDGVIIKVTNAAFSTSTFELLKTAARIADGGVGAPAWSFIADTDTGVYRAADNSIGFATGGAFRALIDNTGIVATMPVTGAAGLKIVCVDTASWRFYASTSDTQCAN